MTLSREAEATLVEEYMNLPTYDDPHPVLNRLREEAPLLRAPDHWLITKSEFAEIVFKDPATFVNSFSARGDTAPDPYMHDPKDGTFCRWYPHILLMLDGKPHLRVRRLMQRAFTPRAMERFRTEVHNAFTAQLESLPESRRFDFRSDFALPMPTRIILDVLGLPQSEAYRFYEISNLIIPPRERGTPEEWFEQADGILDNHVPYLLDEAEKRRVEPRDDLLSSIANAEIDGDRLGDLELVATVTFLITAGYESTANTLTNGVYSLLTNPAELERLRADRSLIPTAAEEILRYDSAVRRSHPRSATKDIELGGRQIRKGDRILTSLHAINRDPDRIADPMRFDVGRSPNPHFTFAAGPHQCLGMHLARLEIRLGLTAVLDHLPTLRLDGEPVYGRNPTIRGFEALPVAY